MHSQQKQPVNAVYNLEEKAGPLQLTQLTFGDHLPCDRNDTPQTPELTRPQQDPRKLPLIPLLGRWTPRQFPNLFKVTQLEGGARRGAVMGAHRCK